MILLLGTLVIGASGCSDGNGQSEAQRIGLGAECLLGMDCGEGGELDCIPFDGGYCTSSGCQALGCPDGSLCARDAILGQTFCMLSCESAEDCNSNRSDENAAECTSSIEILDEVEGAKVCVPPANLPS